MTKALKTAEAQTGGGQPWGPFAPGSICWFQKPQLSFGQTYGVGLGVGEGKIRILSPTEEKGP